MTDTDTMLRQARTDDTVVDHNGRGWRLIADADPSPGCAVWVVALDNCDEDALLAASDIAAVILR